jgi:hypothetical protein
MRTIEAGLLAKEGCIFTAGGFFSKYIYFYNNTIFDGMLFHK